MAHGTATGLEDTMDETDAPRLTRTRGDLGVSDLTPGRDPILRRCADKDQTLQPEMAAPVLPQLDAEGTATEAASMKAPAWGAKARTPDQKEPRPEEVDGEAQQATQEGGAPPQGPLENGPTPAVAALRKPTERRLSAELGAKEPEIAAASREESITPAEMASRMKPKEMGAHKTAGANGGIMEDPWLSKVNPPNNTQHGNSHAARTDVRGEPRDKPKGEKCGGVSTGGVLGEARRGMLPPLRKHGAPSPAGPTETTHKKPTGEVLGTTERGMPPPPRKRGAPSPAGLTETSNKIPHTKPRPNQVSTTWRLMNALVHGCRWRSGVGTR
jgi:hypothetical protein